jgi:hypothetical protein
MEQNHLNEKHIVVYFHRVKACYQKDKTSPDVYEVSLKSWICDTAQLIYFIRE